MLLFTLTVLALIIVGACVFAAVALISGVVYALRKGLRAQHGALVAHALGHAVAPRCNDCGELLVDGTCSFCARENELRAAQPTEPKYQPTDHDKAVMGLVLQNGRGVYVHSRFAASLLPTDPTVN